MYSEPEEMQKAVDAYFDDCAGKWLVDQNGRYAVDTNGRPIRVNMRPPTITGLALALGFSTRKSLLDYQRKPKFRDTVTIAKTRVEQYVEESLFNPDSLTGAKFCLLCCFGWAQDVPEASSGNIVPVKIVNV